MTSCATFFRGLLFDAFVGTQRVRILVFDNLPKVSSAFKPCRVATHDVYPLDWIGRGCLERIIITSYELWTVALMSRWTRQHGTEPCLSSRNDNLDWLSDTVVPSFLMEPATEPKLKPPLRTCSQTNKIRQNRFRF